jgi:undecaprenyl-diphosphatase
MDLDRRLFDFFNQRLAVPALDPMFHALSDARLWWAVAIAITLYQIVRRKRQVLLVWAMLLPTIGLTDWITSRHLKEYIHRDRPCFVVSTARVVAPNCGPGYSLPSTHAANGMAITTMVWLLTRSPWALWIALFALLSGYSRVALGVHFPGDVLAGYLVGAIMASTLYGVFRFFQGWREARRPLSA